ncbi:site-specific integrase [Thermococcus sp. GR7]|uniref:tyrosine-type recombinase/integrase n=3 Tax=Thermococcus TaxID=2263 RepID=UPI001F0E1EBB|nr:site-specific integrase [Thermococcus sp. GR7]
MMGDYIKSLSGSGVFQQVATYQGTELLGWARIELKRIFANLIQELVNETGLDYTTVVKALQDITEALVESRTIMFTKTLTEKIVKHSGAYYIKVHEDKIKEITWAYNKLRELGLTSEGFKIEARIDTLVGFNNRLSAKLELKKKNGSYYLFKVPTKVIGKLESAYVDVVLELDNPTAQLISRAHQDADKVVDFVRQVIETGQLIDSANQRPSIEHLLSNVPSPMSTQGTIFNVQQPDNLLSSNALSPPQVLDDISLSQNKEVGNMVKGSPSFKELVEKMVGEGKKILKSKSMYIIFDDNTVVIDTTKAIDEFKKWSIRDFEYEMTENGTVRTVRYTDWDEFVNDKNMPPAIEKSRRNILQRIRYVEVFLEYTQGVITEETIEDFFDWLQYKKPVTNGGTKRRGVSKDTFNKYKSHIKKFFEFLKLRHYQGYVSQVTYTAKTKRTNGAKVVDEDDIKNLIKQLMDSNKFTQKEKDELIGLVLLEATTGLRTSEALRLKVGDIDFGNRVVLVRSEITKKNYSRIVYITEEVARYLKDNVVGKYNKSPNDYLFSPNISGFKESSKGRVTQRLKRIGIDFNMKSLRKFYVTMTRNPPKEAFELLKTNKALDSLEFLTAGHKTLQIVESHYDYTKTSVEEILKKAKLLDRLLTRREVYDVVFNGIKFLE